MAQGTNVDPAGPGGEAQTPPADPTPSESAAPEPPEGVAVPSQDEKQWMPLGVMFLLGLWSIATVVILIGLIADILEGMPPLNIMLSMAFFLVVSLVAYGMWKRWAVSWFVMIAISLGVVAFQIYLFVVDVSVQTFLFLILNFLLSAVIVLYLFSKAPVEWFGLDPKWSRL